MMELRPGLILIAGILSSSPYLSLRTCNLAFAARPTSAVRPQQWADWSQIASLTPRAKCRDVSSYFISGPLFRCSLQSFTRARGLGVFGKPPRP